MSAATMAAQAATLKCLAGIAVSYPNLPGAYFTASSVVPNELSVQLDSPSKVEAWRVALNVPVEKVFMDRIGDQLSLEFRATAYRVAFHVYAVYDAATVEAGAA
ncbi:hypothetical protein ACFVFQ_08930 [Streptomyces sp. NPDC057743]|uniref:hypothetical protein n=1 Tax=Streptomyces sp. NPDC057743 TaxID=3346236 RepID=UPI0036753991